MLKSMNPLKQLKKRVLEKTVQEHLTLKNKSEAKSESLEKQVLPLKSKLPEKQHMI